MSVKASVSKTFSAQWIVSCFTWAAHQSKLYHYRNFLAFFAALRENILVVAGGHAIARQNRRATAPGSG
jgi:hypothetical protein